MDVFVDDNKVDTPAWTGETVEDALRQVQDQHCPAGRMVVALRCDGTDVPAGEMASALREQVGSIERLEVFTSTRATLVMDAMSQASASLEEMITTTREVADMLDEGKTAEGRKALGECVEMWKSIHEGMGKAIELLELDPRQATTEGTSLIDLIKPLRDLLLGIKQALEAGDDVMLADILRYEFASATEQWRSVMALLQEEARGAGDEEGDCP